MRWGTPRYISDFYSVHWWKGIYADAERVGLTIRDFRLQGMSSSLEGQLIFPTKTARAIIENHRSNQRTYRLANSFLDKLALGEMRCAAETAKGNDDYRSRRWRIREITLKQKFEQDILAEYLNLLKREAVNVNAKQWEIRYDVERRGATD